jgi:repressor LexA
MEPLSPEEQRLFDCLIQYWEDYSYSPGIQDLIDGMQTTGRRKVQTLLASLKQKQYIDWTPNQHRSYRILVQGVPVLGVIQAGLVIEHPADQVEWIRVPGVSYRSDQYALWVCGDSMKDEHIRDGDLVLLSSQFDLWALPRGAIAAVRVEGCGATLKSIAFDGESVFLKPANPAYSTVKLKPNQVSIQGMLIRVIRNYQVFT